jgi:hypothetical protein
VVFVVMLERRLLTGLWCMLGIWRNFFAVIFLFLLDFLVVGNVSWVSHEDSWCMEVEELGSPAVVPGSRGLR